MGPLGRRVGVVVDAARRGGVCLSGHQPGRAVEGIPGPRWGAGATTRRVRALPREPEVPEAPTGQMGGCPGGRKETEPSRQAAGSASREAAGLGARIRCTRVQVRQPAASPDRQPAASRVTSRCGEEEGSLDLARQGLGRRADRALFINCC